MRAQLASAAAWSLNPKNLPLYLDLPTKDGAARPEVLAKWAANAPLAFVDQHIGTLPQYQGITSAVADRFQHHVLPSFSKNLCATAKCK